MALIREWGPVMGEVVNLNQYRKERARARKRQRASRNRIRHGLSKAERDEARVIDERRNKELEGKRLGAQRPADEPPSAS